MKTFIFGRNEVYWRIEPDKLTFKHKQDPMIDGELSPRDHKKKFEVEFIFENRESLEFLINSLNAIRDNKIFVEGQDRQIEYFRSKLGLEVK